MKPLKTQLLKAAAARDKLQAALEKSQVIASGNACAGTWSIGTQPPVAGVLACYGVGNRWGCCGTNPLSAA